jgi:hypothetical protein
MRVARFAVCVSLLTAAVGWTAPSPAHAEPEAAVCTVLGVLTFAPALGLVPAPTVVGGTLTLNCPILGDDAGVWTLFPAGVAIDSCLLGNGTGGWVAPSTGPPGEGAAVGPGFDYVHMGGTFDFVGTVPAAGPPPETHQFVAHLGGAPVGCPAAGVIGVTGTAVLVD